MRVLLIGFLLTLAALAGCIGDTDDDHDDDHGHDHDDGHGHDDNGHHNEDDHQNDNGDTGNGEDDNGNGNETEENSPPTESLSASIEQGQIPFNVTFTLDGSDPDGDPLTWTLDFGDGNNTDGSELPTTLNHTYTQRGLFNVTFNVTDGTDTVTRELTINATAAAAGEGPALIISGETIAPGNPTTSILLGANGCAGFNAGENGIDCVFGEIPAELEGRDFILESDVSAPDYEFWDSCDPMGMFIQEFGGPHEGTIPAGVGCVIMWNYGDGTGSFTFTVF